MIAFEASVKIKTKRDFDDIMEPLQALGKKRVLVGVPENEDPREQDGGSIGNAALAYIHDNGAPSVGIPARPFMQPGINKVQSKINRELRTAATAALEGTPEGVDLALNSAGMIAQSSIRNIIRTSEGFAPLKRATLLGRVRKRSYLMDKFKNNKGLKEEYMASLKPLMDTNQLLRAITYVIEDIQ